METLADRKMTGVLLFPLACALLVGCLRSEAGAREEPAPEPAPSSSASAPPAGPSTASAPAPSRESAEFPWPGSPLPVTTVRSLPLSFVLGDDVFDAVLAPGGWVGVRSPSPEDLSSDLVVQGRPGQPRVVIRSSPSLLRPFRSAGTVWIRREATSLTGWESPTGMARLVRGRLEELKQVPRFEWGVEFGARTLAVFNRGETQRTSRWQVAAIEGASSILLAEATSLEYACGAALHRGELVVAVRLPDSAGAFSQQAQVQALTRTLDGDFRDVARLAGPPRGALIYLDRAGALLRREDLTVQRPGRILATDDGWLVLLGEGTLARGLQDAVVLARSPAESSGWHLLAAGLKMPGDLVGHGSWVCFEEQPADQVAVHCLDPGRGLHRVSEPLEGTANLFDVELKPVPRLIFRILTFGPLRHQTREMRLVASE